MEADIILEGFQVLDNLYNTRIIHYIADADASTFPQL